MAIGDQSQQATSAGLDLSQISNVVNMSKISDKRKRNEMMRLGTTDPNAFALQNQQQLQQPQQPTEFWGAGRQLAQDQTPDVDASSALGSPLSKLGSDYYYYGNNDYSTAQFGTQGYQTNDLGFGKYDILDQAGKSLGTGYRSVGETVKSYLDNATGMEALKQQQSTLQGLLHGATSYKLDPSSGYGTIWDASKALEDTKNKLASMPSYESYYDQNPMNQWEMLGQFLNNSVTPQYAAVNPYGVGNIPQQLDSDSKLATNDAYDVISGLNTLYGSTPLINNGKLIGYKMDLGPNTGAGNPFAYVRNAVTDEGQFGGVLSRVFNDPASWGNLTKALGSTNVFAPIENVEKLPGWVNNESLWYNEKPMSSLYGHVFNALDPILDKVDPLHNPTQEAIRSAGGFDSQQQAFETIIPTMVSFFGGPYGGLLNAANTASTGDKYGGIRQGLFSVASMGDGSASTSASSYLQDNYGMSAGVADAVVKAAAAGASAGISGGSASNGLLAALGSLAGSGTSSLTSDYGRGISGFLSGATEGAIRSANNPKHMMESALTSGIGTGLGGLFTSQNADAKTQSNNTKTGMAAANLAKLFIKKGK